MKTIAITIEEDTLRRIDHLAGKNRSGFIREAVREHLSRIERQIEEDREREIIRRHRKKLRDEAVALVSEQAQS